MEDAVGEIVPEGGKAAMDVPRLSALVAIAPGERRAAIEAGALMIAVMRLARPRLELPGDDAAGQRVANPFDSPRIHARMMAETRGRVEPVPAGLAAC
jgi:hypothetical protein